MSADMLLLAIAITVLWLMAERLNTRKASQPMKARRVARRVKAIRRSIPIESLSETKANVSRGYPISESDHARLIVNWLWTLPLSGESDDKE